VRLSFTSTNNGLEFASEEKSDRDDNAEAEGEDREVKEKGAADRLTEEDNENRAREEDKEADEADAEDAGSEGSGLAESA